MNTKCCSIENCDKPVRTRGLCNMHYARLLRNGTTDTVRKINYCVVEGCEERVAGNGYCRLHWTRLRHGYDPARLADPKRTPTQPTQELPSRLTREQWIIWAAGFFDGEGSIRLKKASNGTSYMVQLYISQVNPEPIHILQSLFGGVVSHKASHKENWRDQCCLELVTSQAVDALRAMLPYLIVKREEAELIMEYMRTLMTGNLKRGVSSDVVALRTSLVQRITDIKHRTYT